MPRASKRLTLAAPPPDPFGERRRPAYRERLRVLGGDFHFETDSARLLRIVRLAYAGLPPQRFAGSAPQLRVRLVVVPGRDRLRSDHGLRDPPAITALAADGLLCGAAGGATVAAITPAQRSALLIVSRALLRYPYHVRYELLEFAVYVLAARVQRLVPLHAACVGAGESGVLVMGHSGAGKSTLMLQCLLGGLEFAAEDSVLVRPHGLRATGVASFLHLCPDALRFLDRAERSRLLRRARLIRRRSGVAKLEIDLRHSQYRLARKPLRIRAVIFLSARQAQGGRLLRPLDGAVVLRRLLAQQRYAAKQPGWASFRRQLLALPAYELSRGAHPRDSVGALQQLLAATALGRSP